MTRRPAAPTGPGRPDSSAPVGVHSRGIGPRTDVRLGRGTSHAQQAGPGVGPYYLGHALSRPQRLGSTAEGRCPSVAADTEG